jgi:hypothetical protein
MLDLAPQAQKGSSVGQRKYRQAAVRIAEGGASEKSTRTVSPIQARALAIS